MLLGASPRGFVQPLDDLLERASDAYDVDDFFEPLLRCNKWSGRFGDPLGEGPLLEIPVNCESYNLAFVPEVLDRAGLEVPGTWEQYFATARQVVGRTDGEVRGFAQRGTGAWHTMYTGFATQLWSSAAATLRTAAARSRRPPRCRQPGLPRRAPRRRSDRVARPALV